MILVINCGSSSIKYKLYRIKSGKVDLVAENSLSNIDPSKKKDFESSFNVLLQGLNEFKNNIEYVGYRIVCGNDLDDGVAATDKIVKEIENLKKLGPLHNKNAAFSINSAKKFFNKAKHLCYFDSSYFKSLPDEEQMFPVDFEIIKKYKLRRYGYHGISHQFAYEKIKPKKTEKVVIIHLGAGCSVSAVMHGQPIATSMGLTPLEGVIMQTRGGNLDPGLVLFLVEELGLIKTKDILNLNSGLAGMTKTNGSMLDILYLSGEKIEDDDYIPEKTLNKNNQSFKASKFALEAYCNSIKKYIGSYSALMSGLDRIIFTGKIGSGSSVIRKKIISRLEYLKIKNVDIVVSNEELAIAEKILNLIRNGKK